MDDTVRHVAQALLGGIPFYTSSNVTERVQLWFNEEGEEGQFPDIDDAIEADLKEFFKCQ